MKITIDTPTITVLPYLNEEYVKVLMDKIPAKPMKRPIWEMTCGEFINCLDENYARTFFEEEKIGDAIGHLKTFNDDMEKLSKYLNLNQIKETNEEQAAKKGVVFPTFAENILITVAEFFHLKSFEEAEKTPFSDYLIIQKHQTANSKYERNLNTLYMNKSKKKK